MKAIILERFGDPGVLTVGQRPKPTAGPGEILVRVRSAGVNFAETLMRQNRYAMTPPLPSILGSEVAGEVEAVGEGVDTIKVGQRVAAPLFAAGVHFGGYAEYTTIEARWAVPLPDSVMFDDAVALMVQGMTAIHLVRRTNPGGKRVFVSAAAGGVGSFLIQLLKLEGASHIIAAAGSEEKREYARSLGADQAIDYTSPNWHALLQGETSPDIIYESTGGQITLDALGALAPLGQMVIFGALNIQSFQLGVPELLGLIFKNQSITGFALVPLLSPDNVRADLAMLFELVAQGSLTVHVGGRFPLHEANAAHMAIENRQTIGKVVLYP